MKFFADAFAIADSWNRVDGSKKAADGRDF